jgi:hypothetical protein
LTYAEIEDGVDDAKLEREVALRNPEVEALDIQIADTKPLCLRSLRLRIVTDTHMGHGI